MPFWPMRSCGRKASGLIAAYIEPESDRPTIINDLIRLFDGPVQREAERLAAEALGDPGVSCV